MGFVPSVASVGHGHEECPGLKEAVREQAAQLAQLQIARYEAARIAPPREGDERASGAEGHLQYPQGKGTVSGMGGGPGPGGGGDNDPNGDAKVVPVDTRKSRGRISTVRR